MQLFFNGMPKRMSPTGFGIKGTLVDDQDMETEVSVMYDYLPRQSSQPNPDRANPGPGRDAELDITDIIDSSSGEHINPAGVSFDEGDLIEVTDEAIGMGVGWNRRMAGL